LLFCRCEMSLFFEKQLVLRRIRLGVLRRRPF
jgi:hypothetical protein